MTMSLVDEIIAIQSELHIPDYIMCNIFNVSSLQLRFFKSGKFELSTYSLIMFIIYTAKPLHSLDKEME